MAQDVFTFSALLPVGTSPTNLTVVALTIPPRIVTQLQVRVPPGPNGEVGFAIGAAGQPVIPFNAGAFIVTDNELIDWPIRDGITSGAWQLFGYNTGFYPHTLQVRLLCDLLPDGGSSAAQVLPLSQLTPAIDLSQISPADTAASA